MLENPRLLVFRPASPRRSPAQWLRRCRRTLVGLGLFCAIGLAATYAAAQAPDEASRVTARRLAEEAADLYDAGKYEQARDLFSRAYSLVGAPTLGLWEARCLAHLGRLVEAEGRYAEVARYELGPDDPQLFQDAVRDAGNEVDKIRKRIPTVKIVLVGAAQNDPAVEIRVDGVQLNSALIGVATPVDPGKREITASIRGELRARVETRLQEGDRKQVKLDVSELSVPTTATPGPEEPPADRSHEVLDDTEDDEELDARPPPPVEPSHRGSVQRSLGTITLGLGIVGVTTGLVAGVIALGKHSTLEEHCAEGNCPPPYHDDLEAFRTFRTVSTIGYAVGAGGVVIGSLLLLTAPSSEPEADSGAVRVWVGLSSAGVSGRF